MEFNKMSEGYKKQLNEVQLELLNNRQHMINTEAQVRVLGVLPHHDRVLSLDDDTIMLWHAVHLQESGPDRHEAWGT